MWLTFGKIRFPIPRLTPALQDKDSCLMSAVCSAASGTFFRAGGSLRLEHPDGSPASPFGEEAPWQGPGGVGDEGAHRSASPPRSGVEMSSSGGRHVGAG